MAERRIALSVAASIRTAAEQVKNALSQSGQLVECFSVDAVDRSDFESIVKHGQYVGVVDLALSDLLVELGTSANSNRLTAAPALGLPLVIVPGGCDEWPSSDGPRAVSLKEIERLAKDVAQKASASRGPVSILVPWESWSDGKSVNLEVAQVFVDCVRLWLSPAVRLHTISGKLSSLSFAQRTADETACLISAEPWGRRSASC